MNKYIVHFDGATDAVKEELARLYSCMDTVDDGKSKLAHCIDDEEAVGVLGQLPGSGLTSTSPRISRVKKTRVDKTAPVKRLLGEAVVEFTVYISTWGEYPAGVALYIRRPHLDFDTMIITPTHIEYVKPHRGEGKVEFRLFPNGDDISSEFPLEWAREWLKKIKNGEFKLVKED